MMIVNKKDEKLKAQLTKALDEVEALLKEFHGLRFFCIGLNDFGISRRTNMSVIEILGSMKYQDFKLETTIVTDLLLDEKDKTKPKETP